MSLAYTVVTQSSHVTPTQTLSHIPSHNPGRHTHFLSHTFSVTQPGRRLTDGPGYPLLRHEEQQQPLSCRPHCHPRRWHFVPCFPAHAHSESVHTHIYACHVRRWQLLACCTPGLCMVMQDRWLVQTTSLHPHSLPPHTYISTSIHIMYIYVFCVC